MKNTVILLIAAFVPGTAAAQYANDPYQAEQSHVAHERFERESAEVLQKVQFLFFAVGCKVFPDEGMVMPLQDEIVQSVIERAQRNGIYDAVNLNDRLPEAREQGERKAQTPGACEFWHKHPDVVNELRRNAEDAFRLAR